jgi:hypothetical protein
MQTFVPYGRCFSNNAKVLDRQRLGKQRVEGLQIIRTLLGINYGWQHHPAVKMWDGYEVALGKYTLEICGEWVSRGYRDTCADKVRALLPGIDDVKDLELPPWIDSSRVTLSHKSNLIRKDPSYYGPIWPNVPSYLPYNWPV